MAHDMKQISLYIMYSQKFARHGEREGGIELKMQRIKDRYVNNTDSVNISRRDKMAE